MPHPAVLHLRAPAKINLALSVAAPLISGPAQGLHPIASWIVALDFADDLTLAPGSTTFDIAYHADAPRPQPIDWPLEKDLAYRALQLLRQHVGRDLPVHVTLRKRIPAGGGLGGGSSNAAAMLVGLNQLFNLQLPTAVLCRLAAALGSDVAFFITALAAPGPTPSHASHALVTGTGDHIQPLSPPSSSSQAEGLIPGFPNSANPQSTIRNPKSQIPLALFFPPFGCPTGPVYRAFDNLGAAPAQPDERRVRNLMQLHPLPPDAPFNDLAEPARLVQPALRTLQRDLAATLQWPIHVTGSGSTLFALATSSGHARALAAGAAPLLPALATVTR